MILLSIPDSPDVVFTTILDGVAYDLRIQWNTRDESWYLYLARQNNEFAFKTKITTNTDLLKIHRANDSCPKGMLLPIDNMKYYGRISREGWNNNRFSLYYITEDERDIIESYKMDADVSIVTDCSDDLRFSISATKL